MVSTFERKADTNWLASLLPRLDRRRVVPTIACMYGGGKMQEWFGLRGIETANFASPGEIDLAVIGRICRYIRSGRFDAVHTHLLRADLYAGLAARLAGTRVIISTIHAIGQYRREKRRRLDGLLDELTRLWPTHLLAVSQAVKDDCVRRLRWPESKVSVIRTGIEPSEFGRKESARRRIRTEWELEPATPLIVTVARLSYEKGLPTLIEAARVVTQRHPTATFVIVGDGPMKAELETRIAVANLCRRVRLAGFRADVPDVLAAADMFCMPSYMEGLPIALLEAMAAELPVVATGVGGIPELLAAKETGIRVTPHRPDELAEAIDRLLEDPALMARMGKAGRARVTEHFSVDVVAEEYTALYEALASGEARRDLGSDQFDARAARAAPHRRRHGSAPVGG